MRRKSDFNSALDEMFCQDDKKRINAIKMVKEIAATIGPLRVRNELIPFMNQFLDDDPVIMLALIEELDNFTPLLGGSQHEKSLLPLLINFCLLDQKEVALKSLAIITQILSRNPDSYLETIKKMCKPDMNVSKQCTLQLIVSGLKKVPQQETSLLEIYKTIVSSQNPSYRICAAKYVKKLTENTNNKEQICKIIQIVFNDSQDLSKLFAIDTLLLIYPSNPNLVIAKLKILICMGTWRINIKLCQFANDFCSILTKVHFKSLLEPAYLKMLTSDDNEIKAAACSTMISIAKNMSEEDNFTKLLPTVLSLSETKIDFVKNQFAKNFVKIFPYFSAEKTKQVFIPLVIKFLKQSNLEVSSKVLQDFKQLSKHFKDQKFQQNILKPLANQLAAENWRLKIQTLDILGKIIIEQEVYSSFVVDLLIKQMKSKVEAVRLKASSVIAKIIKKSPKDWCQKVFLPELLKSKDDPSYLIRQRVIAIMSETVDSVSIPWVATYTKTMNTFLTDRTPNIRVLALKSISQNRKLMDKSSQNLITKLKDDNDLEIKKIAKEIKI